MAAAPSATQLEASASPSLRGRAVRLELAPVSPLALDAAGCRCRGLASPQADLWTRVRPQEARTGAEASCAGVGRLDRACSAAASSHHAARAAPTRQPSSLQQLLQQPCLLLRAFAPESRGVHDIKRGRAWEDESSWRAGGSKGCERQHESASSRTWGGRRHGWRPVGLFTFSLRIRAS